MRAAFDRMKAKYPLRRFLVVGVSAALTTMPSYAADQTQISQIVAVYPMANGSFAISLRDQPTTCSSTMTPKRFYVSVGQNSVTEDGAKRMYAAALTALTTDLNVYVVWDDSSSSCYINRLLIYK